MIRTIKQLKEVAESNDWNVAQDKGGYTRYDFCLSQYSSAGQDFFFYAQGNTLSEVVDNAEEYAENFDTDEAASVWIGADGHGKNGAPYRISDILADMEECKQSMLDLVNAWKNY